MLETKKYALFVLAGGAAGLLLSMTQFPPVGSGVAGKVGGAFIEVPGDFPVVPNLKTFKVPVPRGDLTKLQLSARAALVKDFNTGIILYEKNFREVFPIASLTKLMTALVVAQQLPLGRVVEIRPEDLATAPYKAGFLAGERLVVSDLLKAMLISSANDATLALAREASGSAPAFVAAMNAKAQGLGMTRTAFMNPVGFDDPGHFSTAEDLAILVTQFQSYPALAEIVREKEAVVVSVDGTVKHSLRTTNKLLEIHEEVAGIKTGYTAEARGNLIILVDRSASGFQADRTAYYSIVLGSEQRERDTEAIMDWVEENYLWD